MLKLREPQGEIARLGLYCGREVEDSACLRSVIASLASFGAQLSGYILVHSGEGLSPQGFAYISDYPTRLHRIYDFDDLNQIFLDNRHCVVSVYMKRASGIDSDIDEIISFSPISEHALGIDHHPVCIITEGWVFSGVLDAEDIERRHAYGDMMSRRLLELVESVRPSYAGIFGEDDISCPVDLLADPSRSIFKNFYLNTTKLGLDLVNHARAMYSQAYQYAVADGVYISCDAAFNPKHIEWRPDTIFTKLSPEIAGRIADRLTEAS